MSTSTNELLKAAAVESRYGIGGRLSSPKACFVVIAHPRLGRYDLQREDTFRKAMTRLRWKEVNVFAPAIGIVRDGVILMQHVDKPALPTMRERFHKMSTTDPLYYRFQDIWARVNQDKGIGYGLWLVDENAAFDMKMAAPVVSHGLAAR